MQENLTQELIMHFQLKIRTKLEQIDISPCLPYRERVVVDQECKGLRFVAAVDAQGGHWIRRYKDSVGKMKQYTFAEYPDVSVHDARAYINSVRGKKRNTYSSNEPTVGILIDKYLNEYIYQQRTFAAAAGVKSALINNLKSIASTKLKDITPAMLHDLILTVKQRAPTMAKLTRTELKLAWSYALAIGLTNVPCPINSLTGGRFKPSIRDRVLSDREVTQIINKLDVYTLAVSDVIIIGLYTALRSGEVIATSASEFETDDAGVLWLSIPASRMKTGMAHRVPIFGLARTVIDRRIAQHSSYLFPAKRTPGKPILQSTLSREVYAVDSDVPDWHLHDLRRTTRTNLQRIGCPFEISESILAHRLPGVAGVYARYQYAEEKIKWLKQIADHYDAINSDSSYGIN